MSKISIELAQDLMNQGVELFNQEIAKDGDKVFTKFELSLIEELGGTDKAKNKILRVMRRSYSVGYLKAKCIERINNNE